MTISYTNDIKTNISDPLQLLMFTELKPIPVELEEIFNPANMTRGKYVRYWILGSDEEAKHSDGETRNYEIEIVYYFDIERHDIKKAFDSYSDDKEHLKRLLDNNNSYNDGTYRWHNLVVAEDPLQTVEELEEIEDEQTKAQRFLVTITRSNFR
jgi:hypothetical protein